MTSAADPEIRAIPPSAAAALIAELDAYQERLYPPESNHLDPLATLAAPNVVLLGAIEGGEVLAIGAVKVFDGYGEIKRVYVPPRHRRRGLARRIMEALEARLVERGVAWARLETGIRQPEAIELYRRLGYRETAPFGAYRLDPLSLFMEKRLDAAGDGGDGGGGRRGGGAGAGAGAEAAGGDGGDASVEPGPGGAGVEAAPSAGAGPRAPAPWPPVAEPPVAEPPVAEPPVAEPPAPSRPGPPPPGAEPVRVASFALGVLVAKALAGTREDVLEALEALRKLRAGLRPRAPAPPPEAAGEPARAALPPALAERAAAIDRLAAEAAPHLASRLEQLRGGLADPGFTYGGTPAALVLELLERAEARPDEVFCDLGSGVGTAVLAAALVCREAHGVERIAALVTAAREHARALGIANARFHEADLAETCAPEATLFYAYATCYPPPLMDAVRRVVLAAPSGARVVSVTRAVLDPELEPLWEGERAWPGAGDEPLRFRVYIARRR